MFLAGIPVGKDARLSAQQNYGASLMAASDFTKLKFGLEAGVSFYEIGLFYNYYDSVDYVRNSKVYEFDGAAYSYSVRGKRNIYGVRWSALKTYGLPTVNDQTFIYIGYGRNTIEGSMIIDKISTSGGSLNRTEYRVRSEFLLESFMVGLFAKSASRIALDARMRYDRASIPIIDEVSGEKRSGQNINYQDIMPELLIGWAF
ncbi:hypothetical protein CHS0354_018469 [Potamilus streckersoni]|uniref:Uncharacterized protein n=1 Tax=Potamilus streckersoni TaxID=2493646 RepID=A0AAE0TAL6_9BIVA|nr:hypothetical protein CHS0354_018469 [Potamilus streckersoni]